VAPLGLLAGVSVLLAVIAWRARAFFAALDRVAPAAFDPESSAPLVSVVIPVRNEAANIGRCLRSVCDQDYPNLHVVVVDDNSTDETPANLAEMAAGEPRLTVIQGMPLEAGWTGKNFALAQATPHLRGEWVLFLDADTWLERSAISAAVSHAEQRGLGLLSLIIGQQMIGFWERVVEPFVMLVIALCLPMRAIMDPARPRVAYAYGKFLLLRRAAYEKTGGHQALGAAVLEDSVIARAVKAAGFTMQLADGRALVHVRKYQNLSDIWEGWTKNSFLSLDRSVRKLLLLVAAVIIIVLGPPTLFLTMLVSLAGFGGLSPGNQIITAISGLQVFFVLCLGWRTYQEFGVPSRYALTVPLGALMFVVLVSYSACCMLTGRGVKWKGRSYHP
jgi:chlorobactene glucosyltransferase